MHKMFGAGDGLWMDQPWDESVRWFSPERLATWLGAGYFIKDMLGQKISLLELDAIYTVQRRT
eukprot:651144-Pleurochrysis_carterae.AAC.5